MFTDLKLIQKRIADISISGSTLRGQGVRAAENTINYLKDLDLTDFNDIKNEDDFLKTLNEHTDILKNKLPNESWGAARKALNIFLFQVCHDIYLSKEYNLINIIPYLELPLDNPNAKNLKQRARNKKIRLHWTTIKDLEHVNSNKFQEFARSVAKNEYNGCDRCYLDVYWWRN